MVCYVDGSPKIHPNTGIAVNPIHGARVSSQLLSLRTAVTKSAGVFLTGYVEFLRNRFSGRGVIISVFCGAPAKHFFLPNLLSGVNLSSSRPKNNENAHARTATRAGYQARNTVSELEYLLPYANPIISKILHLIY